jgi:hypothetical protein
LGERFERLARVRAKMKESDDRRWQKVVAIIRKYPDGHRLYPFGGQDPRVFEVCRDSMQETYALVAGREDGDHGQPATDDAKELWRLDRWHMTHSRRHKVWRDALVQLVEESQMAEALGL